MQKTKKKDKMVGGRGKGDLSYRRDRRSRHSKPANNVRVEAEQKNAGGDLDEKKPIAQTSREDEERRTRTLAGVRKWILNLKPFLPQSNVGGGSREGDLIHQRKTGPMKLAAEGYKGNDSYGPEPRKRGYPKKTVCVTNEHES